MKWELGWDTAGWAPHIWSHINRQRIQLRNINIPWEDIEAHLKGSKQTSACTWVLNAETAQVSLPKPGHNVYLPRITGCLISSCSSYLLCFPWWHQHDPASLPSYPSILSAPRPFHSWAPSPLAKHLPGWRDTLSLHEALSKTLKKGWPKTPTEPKTMTHDFV